MENVGINGLWDNFSCDIMSLLPPRYWQQEGGVPCMELVLSFFVAVMADIACHYIIKWLDGDD